MTSAPSPTLFLTGGSGLLGSQVARLFRLAGWQVHAPTHAELDLLDCEKVRAFCSSIQPNLILNCAACRFPEICEQHALETFPLNVELPALLGSLGIPLIHISTDYVFNGANAPYDETARCQPLNTYGRQKLEAETHLTGLEHVLILRVPLLFGSASGTHRSVVTALADNLLSARGATVLFDNHAIRYPTFTEDVARQLLALAPHVGKPLHGIYHYSAEEPMTKLLMAMTLAPIIGCAMEQCLPAPNLPSVSRPYDAHLSTRKLQQTGYFVPPTPFATALLSTFSSPNS